MKNIIQKKSGAGNVLVTGATGFIGYHLCAALLKKGVRLRVLGRRQPDIDAEFYCWSLMEPLSATSLTGVDTVFHLAGKAHAISETQQDEKEYFQINSEGTLKLLEAARASEVKTFVYFSSVKAVGGVAGAMDESVNIEADTPYGRSKLAAEKLVLEGGYVPHPVVIRPSMVYGNTEKGNLPRMIRAVAAGRFPPLPVTGARRSMLHVDDVVQAALLAAEKPEAVGQTYIVTDEQMYSTRQIYDWICGALGRKSPNWSVPMSVLKLLGSLGDVIGRVRGRRFMFDSDALESLMGSACYSSEKIARELGYKPNRDLQSALPEIVEYLRIKGKI